MNWICSLFGICPHSRLTFPQTPVSRRRHPAGQTYTVCLDCGKEFAYDWETATRGPELRREVPAEEVARVAAR